MRVGENPTKFARRNPELVRLEVKVPEAVLAATVVYIPRLTDYYAEALDVLKLSLASLRATMPVGYDLLVVDNGSCEEVIDYLRELQQHDEIQWLWLSSQNMKKIGAWNQIFGTCQADLVYFFDCDILHRRGWFEASQAVLDAYPRAALVNAAPIPMKNPRLAEATLATTIAIAEDDPEVAVERGHFTADAWFREFGASLGADEDAYAVKARRFEQIRLQRAGTTAFVQSWHAQFLARAEVMRTFFPRERSWAAEHNDRGFDEYLNEHGYMRLATAEPLVAHLGNTIAPRYEAEMARLCAGERSQRRLSAGSGLLALLMHLGPVRKLVLKLHALTFRLIYNVR